MIHSMNRTASCSVLLTVWDGKERRKGGGRGGVNHPQLFFRTVTILGPRQLTNRISARCCRKRSVASPGRFQSPARPHSIFHIISLCTHFSSVSTARRTQVPSTTSRCSKDSFGVVGADKSFS